MNFWKLVGKNTGLTKRSHKFLNYYPNSFFKKGTMNQWVITGKDGDLTTRMYPLHNLSFNYFKLRK